MALAKHPRSGSSGSLEYGRRHSFRKPTRSGNGTQFHKSFVQLPERNSGVTGRTSSRCRPDPKNKQVQQFQAKPFSSYHAFEREVRDQRFYRGTPTQRVPRLIIGDRSSSISSNQIQIRDQIGYHPILWYPGSRKNHNCISDPGVGRNTPEPLRRRDSASARCGE